jgi:hypothetical protein
MGERMMITTKLTDKQLRQVHNLMLNCRDKQDMFDHLIDIGLNAFHALHMSNSFNSLYEGRSIVKVAHSVLSIVEQVKPRTYEQGDYEPRIIA